jgi:8-oxo-dGTP pyrophosphatase MutT (NUDIX family)
MEAKYCLQCGTRLESQYLDGRPRQVCPACGWVHYPHLKVAAAALIEHDGGVLLLQRASRPWQGSWNLPAGYVEVDESPERAAEREAREETGLIVQAGRLFGQYFYDDDLRGNGLLLVFSGIVTGGLLTLNGESTASGYYVPGDLPEDLCGAGHARALADWQRERAR